MIQSSLSMDSETCSCVANILFRDVIDTFNVLMSIFSVGFKTREAVY